MSRSVGAIDALRTLFDGLVPAFALITQLGDVWLYLLVLSGLYLLSGYTPAVGGGVDRRRAALVLALALGAFAVTTALKSALALPRPPGAGDPAAAEAVPAAVRPAYEWMATADGYGFPSGHAVGATAIWGGLAAVLEGGDRRRRLAAAAVVVAAVALSRVVLGVHYAVDVVAGIAVGAAYLWVVLRIARTPARAFALAALIAVAAILVDGPTPDGVRVLGTTVGAVVAWRVVGAPPEPATRREALATAGVGVAAVGVPFLALQAADPGPAVTFLISAAILVGLLVAPLAVGTALERAGRRAQNVSR